MNSTTAMNNKNEMAWKTSGHLSHPTYHYNGLDSSEGIPFDVDQFLSLSSSSVINPSCDDFSGSYITDNPHVPDCDSGSSGSGGVKRAYPFGDTDQTTPALSSSTSSSACTSTSTSPTIYNESELSMLSMPSSFSFASSPSSPSSEQMVPQMCPSKANTSYMFSPLPSSIYDATTVFPAGERKPSVGVNYTPSQPPPPPPLPAAQMTYPMAYMAQLQQQQQFQYQQQLKYQQEQYAQYQQFQQHRQQYQQKQTPYIAPSMTPSYVMTAGYPLMNLAMFVPPPPPSSTSTATMHATSSPISVPYSAGFNSSETTPIEDISDGGFSSDESIPVLGHSPSSCGYSPYSPPDTSHTGSFSSLPFITSSSPLPTSTCVQPPQGVLSSLGVPSPRSPLHKNLTSTSDPCYGSNIAKTVCQTPDCIVCSRPVPDILKVNSPSWSAILRVVFYALKVAYPQKDFFNLRNNVYDFVEVHWQKICVGKTKSDHWRKQLQDTLAHNKKLFASGAEVFKQKGFWKLDETTDPWDEQVQQTSCSDKEKPKVLSSRKPSSSRAAKRQKTSTV